MTIQNLQIILSENEKILSLIKKLELSKNYLKINHEYGIFNELYKNQDQIFDLISAFNNQFGSIFKDCLIPLLQRDDDFICLNLENGHLLLFNWEVGSFLLNSYTPKEFEKIEQLWAAYLKPIYRRI